MLWLITLAVGGKWDWWVGGTGWLGWKFRGDVWCWEETGWLTFVGWYSFFNVG